MGEKQRGYFLALFAAVCWSTSGIFIRWAIVGSGFTPISLAFWRDFLSFVILLLGIALFRPDWLRVERRDLHWLAGFGIAGVGAFHALWNLSILYNGYATATILVFASPAIVTIFAWFLWREPLTRVKILALVLTLTGCILASGIEGLTTAELTASGLLLGLATALTYSGISLFGRMVAPRYSPWTVLLYGFGFGSLVLLPFQISSPPPWPMPTSTWLWVAGLVVVATIVPYGAYLAALRWLPASNAIIVSTSEVAFAAMWGWMVFAEHLSIVQLAGAGLVVSGVVLLALRGSFQR